ncbi:PD-(D/E)XK nuclease family protein [Flavobacteriaceae bacterium]|nr:PD-(D/E)XK nuclease family protein [Flavobacteriaceae bacterium]
MRTFLDEIAQEIVNSKYPFESIKIVVPSRRASLFLKNALARQIQKPIFAPEIVSIENFVEELAGLKKVLPEDLLFECYAAYYDVSTKNQRDSFDQFLGWAPVILSDFNEIDAHLVDAKSFFDFQLSLQEMTQWTKSEEQSKIIENHLAFWKLMPGLYEFLNQRLQQKQQGTLGLIFREAVSNLEFYLNQNYKQHYFVGFNALNESESQIIQEFISRDKGTVHWDIDQHFYQDKVHAAGKFIRQYQSQWKSLRSQTISLQEHYTQPKKIEIIGVSKNIAQAKYAAQLAAKLALDYPDEKTTVVLGNESLLTPALSAIDGANKGWNVTMGYPLKETPTADFFEFFFQLHLNVKNEFFFHKNLKNLGTSPWCQSLFKFHHLDFEVHLKDIESKNLYRFPQNKLCVTEDPQAIDHCFFDPFKTIASFLERLGRICDHFILFLEQSKEGSAPLHLSYFKKFKALFNRLEAIHHKYAFIENLPLLLLVFKTLIKGEKIDFLGEPLEGIQFMGLLETRLLDFENLVITNLNEGILPAGKKSNSFLPFDLKKKFNLPTFLENDAIYTYHFYRLLQRAKRVYLLYNTQSDGLNTGEMSRFLYQLKYQKQAFHEIEEKQLVLDYHTPEAAVRQFRKTENIQQRLKNIAEKGFSPSSLSLYLRNPLEFYYQRVLGIKEQSTMESTINNMDKGNLVHEVVEQLYLPFQNQVLKEGDFEQMKVRLLPLMEERYQSIYHGTQQKTGRNHIIFEVLKKSILDFLLQEQKCVRQGNQIKILHLEHPFEQVVKPPGVDFPVKLIGWVDRIDSYNGMLRVIDYKTGMVQPKQLRLPHWEIFKDNTDYAYLFQILLYSYVHKSLILQYPKAAAGIISFRNLPQYFMPFSNEKDQENGLNSENLIHFEASLFKIISEIFDPKINFIDK